MSDQENTSCQQFEDRLREGIQKLLINGTIAEILQAQIKATNVQKENHVATLINEASPSVHPRADRGKGILHTPVQVEDDDEYYRAFKTPQQPAVKIADMTKPESVGEVKLLANRMAQLEFAFKDKGSHSSRSFYDLALFKDKPLPNDFKLPNFAKFNGTGDPRVHLRQYATFMAATKLTESQIVRFFFTSLEEGPRAWFFDLEDEIKNDWLLLTQKFIKQYEYNT